MASCESQATWASVSLKTEGAEPGQWPRSLWLWGSLTLTRPKPRGGGEREYQKCVEQVARS